MKNQALFSSKDKSKKIKCRLLQFLFGALRVKQAPKGNLNLLAYDRCLSNTGTFLCVCLLCEYMLA